MRGYRLSTYTGKYYDKAREQYRLCVIQRESGGNYAEPSGPWRGAYQFNDGLAASALRAMRDEIVEEYGPAGKRALDALEGTYIHTWPRFFQDAAFWTTFNRGAGASHWAGGSWFCDPARNAESGWPNPNRWNYSPLERDKPNRATSTSTSVPGTTSPTTGSAIQVMPVVLTSSRSFGSPEYSQDIARQHIRQKYGWGRYQFRALKQMWWRESNWMYRAVNNHPNGPWYGLGQVNGGFINSRGYSISQYMSSPKIQVKVGAAYIKQRYGTPSKAWSFWRIRGWY
jgi:hypothetical protein